MPTPGPTTPCGRCRGSRVFGHLTYLIFELVWALPVVLGQWIIGFRQLRRTWRLLLVGALVPTVYFSAADAVAIRAHIWTLNPGRIVGLHVGTLPIEEAIFFLVTNLMVVQGLLLLGSAEQWTRAHATLARLQVRVRQRGQKTEGLGAATPRRASRPQQTGK